MSVRRALFPTLLAITLAGGLLTGAASTADASGGRLPSSSIGHERKPTAAVSLGDSYIAGEGGRWQGNSASTAPGHEGTDRAYADGTADPTRVYGATAGTCDRSDVAPILSAYLPVRKKINLACSGARTYHVLRAQAGGQSYQGEAPQDDQLAAVAKTNDVKLIVVSIGGNDLGFSSIVTSCVAAYLFQTTPCSQTQDAAFKAALPNMKTQVGRVIDDIRGTMRDAGYHDRDYRLILQSYPSPAPKTSRYSGAAPDQRGTVGGCPFYDADNQWAGNTLTPGISAALGQVAKAEHVQFLDLLGAFKGHELCASTDRQSTGNPKSAKSEWVRFIDLTGQGSLSESLHPNRFGQEAVGSCITLAVFAHRDTACHAVPGLPSRAVYLTRLPRPSR